MVFYNVLVVKKNPHYIDFSHNINQIKQWPKSDEIYGMNFNIVIFDRPISNHRKYTLTSNPSRE